MLRLVPAPHNIGDILVFFAFFVGAAFTKAFLITSIKPGIRSKGRDLIRTSRELDGSNANLNALYDMVKKMSQCTRLQDLLDLATVIAALRNTPFSWVSTGTTSAMGPPLLVMRTFFFSVFTSSNTDRQVGLNYETIGACMDPNTRLISGCA